MSTLPDWPGAQHHPTAPLAGESLQRNWRDGPMEPLNAFGPLASAAANAPPGTQADSFGAIGTPFAYGPFGTFAPLKSPASNARSGVPNHHSSPRALVLSRFPFSWHKFAVVNDDGCLRKSLPYLRNSVNWGYAFFQTR